MIHSMTSKGKSEVWPQVKINFWSSSVMSGIDRCVLVSTFASILWLYLNLIESYWRKSLLTCDNLRWHCARSVAKYWPLSSITVSVIMILNKMVSYEGYLENEKHFNINKRTYDEKTAKWHDLRLRVPKFWYMEAVDISGLISEFHNALWGSVGA